MKILQARNPVLTEDGSIDIEVLFEELAPEWIPFTASQNDVEPHGVELYNNALSGMYGTVAPFVPYVPTPEEQAEIDMAEAKQVRADAVEAIVVTVDGYQFDGDEVSQGRMARAVSTAASRADRINRDRKLAYLQQIDGMTPEEAAAVPEPEYDDYLTYTTVWVTADNQVIMATIDQLSRASELAGNLQSGFWPVPYQ